MVNLPIVTTPPGHDQGLGYVLAPWLASLPAGNRDLLSLLPVAGINEMAMAEIGRRKGAGAGDPRRVAIGLMLADPFLRARDVAAGLRRAGIGGVANFPTVQVVDGDTARVFESAGAWASREIAMLAAFKEQGLATIAFACGIEAALATAQVAPDMIVMHPGVALDDWRQRAAAALGVSRAIAAFRGRAGCPILVYRPTGFGAELDQAIAAADGTAQIVG